MRIVFSKVNKAILAALEILDGDIIINPTAISIFPAFSGAIHGTFTKDSGNPVDLITNINNYMVDDIAIPTDTLVKWHIEVVPASTTMSADGTGSQEITINILDSTNVLVNTAVVTVDLGCNVGFLQESQVVTAAGTATVKYYSPQVTGAVQINAVDDSAVIGNDPPGDYFPGVLPGTAQIGLISNANTPHPGTLVHEFHIQPDPSQPKSVPMGTYEDGLVDDGPSNGNSVVNGIAIRYVTIGAIDDTVGLATGIGTVLGACDFKAKCQIKFDLSGSVRFWFALANGDPMTADLPALEMAGFGVNPTLSGGNFYYYVNDGGGGPVYSDTGVAASGFHTLEIIYSVANNGLTFLIDGVDVGGGVVGGPIPDAGTNLGMYLRLRTLENVAHNFIYTLAKCEQKYLTPII